MIKYLKGIYFFKKLREAKPENKPYYVLKISSIFGRDNYEKEKSRFFKENRKLLERKHKLPDLLNNFEELKKYPEGSFAKEYYTFCSKNKLDIAKFLTDYDNFIKVSKEDEAYNDREKVMHDIYHLIFGYNLNRAGEVGAVYTQYLQGGLNGFGFIIKLGFTIAILKSPFKVFKILRVKKLIEERQENIYLRDYPFEDNLDKSLKEIRAELKIPAIKKELADFLKSTI